MTSRRSDKKAECDGRCTCTGGPYLHGRAGRLLVLAQIAQTKKAKADKGDKEK